MAGYEDGELGFEEGMSWLPSQVLDEAFSDDTNTYNKRQVNRSKLHQQQHHYVRTKLPPESFPPCHQQSKISSRQYHRQKYPTNWASRGSGMQAIFLDSGQRSCGTGVFLPQRGGTNFQPSRKPACAPVLLPSRVVQALNLNVHEIGLQISPRKDSKTNNKLKGGNDCNSVKNKGGNDVSGKCSVICQNQSSSPDIFLPKEWTY
ncbi:Phosphoglycerate mutase [Melia azedarach]|uniref:Phosphoglycerate mutase n=1 Tax=Melia azedarach TaxID=155640 RepID=A0ACC1YWA5_MELAZ|nr:Phosphoglycerate mutase [Melia azedarach]